MECSGLQYEQLTIGIFPSLCRIELVAKHRGDAPWPHHCSWGGGNCVLPRIILSHLLSGVSKNDMG